MNIKKGLDYFSFDVDFFQDDKIQFVSARFGVMGEIIAIRLLCKIYREGYFIEWNEDVALLFAKGVGDSCSHSCVNDVVYELVKRGFFDKSIFDRFKILTSRGIQKRYFEASIRRKKVEVEQRLLLAEPSHYQNVIVKSENDNILSQNDNNLNENVDILKQSKVKESKGNEKKESSAHPRACVPPEIREAFKHYYDMRKKIKALMTDRAVELAVMELEKLAPRDYERQKLILEQSTMNSWKGLFELKENHIVSSSNNKDSFDIDLLKKQIEAKTKSRIISE